MYRCCSPSSDNRDKVDASINKMFSPSINRRSHYIFFFFFILAALLPGQGLDPSHSCDLSLSCGNTRSFTHCAGPGIEPASQRAQDATPSFYGVTVGAPVLPWFTLSKPDLFLLRGHELTFFYPLQRGLYPSFH